MFSYSRPLIVGASIPAHMIFGARTQAVGGPAVAEKPNFLNF
jgi:hypothetical protein